MQLFCGSLLYDGLTSLPVPQGTKFVEVHVCSRIFVNQIRVILRAVSLWVLSPQGHLDGGLLPNEFWLRCSP